VGKPSSKSSGFLNYFERFVHSEVSGSVVLLLCTLIALIWANSPWKDSYVQLQKTPLGLAWGSFEFSMSLHHWMNDGLMVIFFFVVGLEIKRELLAGQLSSLRKAMLPIAAALGGMVVPALLYIGFNWSGEGSRGWGIPMATDIAFALGVLAVLGSRIPLGIKVFVTALAIADDLGAVLVIALFYTDTIRISGLAVAGVSLLLLFLTVKLAPKARVLLVVLILGVWAGVLGSGVHATVAGVLAAMVIPVTARIEPNRFFDVISRKIERLRESGLSRQSMLEDEGQMEDLLEIQDASRQMTPSGLQFERYLHPLQAFFILPLFALFNAGVSLTEGDVSPTESPIALGVLVGLTLGKPIGIALFSWLAVRAGWGSLPDGTGWTQILGAGCLAGIGFTMSLFITELAFGEDSLVSQAKVGILAASLVSALIGYGILSRSSSRRPAAA